MHILNGVSEFYGIKLIIELVFMGLVTSEVTQWDHRVT